MMDEHKVEFEKRWQQEVVRLKTEQAVYNDQVQDRYNLQFIKHIKQALELVALKSELRHLLVRFLSIAITLLSAITLKLVAIRDGLRIAIVSR